MTIRIAYVSNSDVPGSSPGLSFSVLNALGFVEAGADFQLLLRQRGAADAASVIRRRFDLPRDLPVVGLRAPRVSGSKMLFYWRVFFWLLQSDRTVVITRNVNFLPWAAAWRQRRRGTRVYFESHDFWSDPDVRAEPLTGRRARHARLERRWTGRMDGLICTSAPQERLYRACYPDLRTLTAVAGCPVPGIRVRTSFSGTLGYIGSIVEHKYPLTLVMDGLAACGRPDIRLICVGARDAQAREFVKAAAERRGLADRVEVHGWLTGADLAAVKERIDVGVAVLADSFWNRLATPLKVLEYLAAPLPFLATRLDGIAALVEDGRHGLLVENTASAWAHGIERIYADFAIYARMAEACRRLAGERGWRQRAEGIMAWLSEGGATS